MSFKDEKFYGDFKAALQKYNVTPTKISSMAGALPAPQPEVQVSNDLDTWVRSLPQGLDDLGLNTYIYSNADLKNADTRNTAFNWYKRIYGLDKEEEEAPELPPLADSLAELSGGMNEGQVRQHLKGLGYESGDISDGWKMYNDEYGYDVKKATPWAQNLAVRFPGKDSKIFDAWLQEIEDAKAANHLTSNDLNWLLAMAEGWGNYYG